MSGAPGDAWTMRIVESVSTSSWALTAKELDQTAVVTAAIRRRSTSVARPSLQRLSWNDVVMPFPLASPDQDWPGSEHSTQRVAASPMSAICYGGMQDSFHDQHGEREIW